MTEKEFASIQKTALITVPLNKIDSACLPCDMASGFFLKYKGNIFFITAQHIYEKDLREEKGKWGIVCNWDINRGTMIKPLNQMGFLISGHFSKKMTNAFTSQKTVNILKAQGWKEVDIAYKIMNFVKTEVKLVDDDMNIIFQENRLPIEDNLITDIDINESYAFSGYVKPFENANALEKICATTCLGHYVTPISFYGLKYTGETKKLKTGEMFVFEMQSPVNAEYIKGCSGAPILDSNGNLVSLVCERHEVKANRYKGIKEKTLIYGLNLKKYKIALDIELK